MFASATSAHIGDGSTALFWFDAWLEGVAPRDLAPSLFAISARKRRTVAAALHGDAWLQDISTRPGGTTVLQAVLLASGFVHCGLDNAALRGSAFLCKAICQGARIAGLLGDLARA
ncbi:hypothetical protein D1007_60624 [Hordeum vulgare]|nr:hypothetical protein D1007_60624 [Hordeum vulgare]